MTLSFDYYKVEIEDAIMLYSVDYANFRCYGSTLVANAAEAAAQAASPGCHVAAEEPALGGPLTTSISYDNQATIETAGADIALNWSFPLRNGNGSALDHRRRLCSITTEPNSLRPCSTS